jgi:hypothetical protein
MRVAKEFSEGQPKNRPSIPSLAQAKRLLTRALAYDREAFRELYYLALFCPAPKDKHEQAILDVLERYSSCNWAFDSPEPKPRIGRGKRGKSKLPPVERVDEIVDWIIKTHARRHEIYQDELAETLEATFGSNCVYHEGGGIRIHPDILEKFKEKTTGVWYWKFGGRKWRKRRSWDREYPRRATY